LQNVGIAAVTPADKLHEILFSEEMIKSRKGDQKSPPPSSAEPSEPAKAG
jgi:hypothetical protein